VIERMADYSVRVPKTYNDIQRIRICGKEFAHEMTGEEICHGHFITIYRRGILVGWFECYRGGVWFPAFNPHRTTPAIVVKMIEIMAGYVKVRAALEDDSVVSIVVIPSGSNFTEGFLTKLGLVKRPESENLYYVKN